MAVIAYWIGLVHRFLHISRHTLACHFGEHYALDERRWRGDGTMKRVEVRCTCGACFYMWWSDAQ